MRIPPRRRPARLHPENGRSTRRPRSADLPPKGSRTRGCRSWTGPPRPVICCVHCIPTAFRPDGRHPTTRHAFYTRARVRPVQFPPRDRVVAIETRDRSVPCRGELRDSRNRVRSPIVCGMSRLGPLAGLRFSGSSCARADRRVDNGDIRRNLGLAWRHAIYERRREPSLCDGLVQWRVSAWS